MSKLLGFSDSHQNACGDLRRLDARAGPACAACWMATHWMTAPRASRAVLIALVIPCACGHRTMARPLLQPRIRLTASIARSHSPTMEQPPQAANTTAMSFGALLKFCVPLLGMGLVTPLLSFVDSAVVGRQSTIQLAALAPATALVDRSTYVFAFLGATTTHFVATARAAHDAEAEGRHVENAFSMALGCGLVLAAALACISPPLLRRVASPALLADARAYTCARALGVPLALLLVVLEASFLGAQVCTQAPLDRP